MEGDPQAQDDRFAEWYVWAKREVSTDSRVCLGAAQAATEALERGASDDEARQAARGSTAGHGIALMDRVSPRRRAYAEWYDWARREIGGGRERQHTAARAALQRLDAGGDAAEAAAAARAVLGPPPPQPQAQSAMPPASSAPAPPVVGAPAPAPAPFAYGPPQNQPLTAQSQPQPAYAAVPAPAYAPYPAYAVQLPPPLAPAHVYAGFWRRGAAWLIDTVLLAVGLVVLSFVGSIVAAISLLSSGQDITNDNALGVQVALLLIMFVLAWLYYAGLESSAWQGSVGKRLMRLLVTDVYGRRITFGRATGRYFGKIVSGLALFVGYLMAAFTERKQALHDLMAGTLVVRQEHLALLISPPPPPAAPQTSQPGAGEVQGA